MVRCIDCVEKGMENPNKADFVLVDYGSVKPLCSSCLEEYCYMEGEINLDFYSLSLGLENLFARLDELLKYHMEMQTRLVRDKKELAEKLYEATGEI